MKKRVVSMLEILCLLSLLSVQTAVQSNIPFTVYGYVSNYKGEYTNGITVAVKNDNTGNILETTTVDGESHSGFYQVNLGNMNGKWVRGDKIIITVNGGVAEFNVPETGYSFMVNLSTTDCLSNVIEAVVKVV
jgi:hypothetical protein